MTERVQQLADLLGVVARFPGVTDVIDLPRIAALNALDPDVVTIALALDAVDPAFVMEIAQSLNADPEPLCDRWPALERWRRAVLEAKTRRAPLEVAAAWELTALECEEAGAVESAENARNKAHAALLGRAAA